MIKSRTKPFIRAIVTLFIMLGLLVTPALRVAAAGPFSINTTSDTHDAASDGICADASGFCSLRAALEEANASPTPTTITLPAGTYNLTQGELDVAPNGNRTITLNGAGAASTIISQTDNTNRVLNIDFNMMGGTNVTISGVTISGGWDKSDGLGGAGILAGSGSGFPRDSLTLTNCVVKDNRVFQSIPTNQPGGGLQMAGGDLTITSCTFSNNSSAASSGGAVAYIAPVIGGTVTISNSYFSGNSVVNNTAIGPVGGGALFLNSDNIAPNAINISNSTFSNNTVTGSAGGTVYGGAILFNTGVLTIDKSVFSGNSATGTGSKGGAIYVDSGTLNMTFSRLKGNTATNGGSGVYNHSANAAFTVAENNWWGCSAGPGGAGCDQAATDGANLDYNPWIVLSNTASPNPIYVNQTTTLSASFLQNSAGAPLSAAQVVVMLGRDVIWSNPVLGTLSNQQISVQANGMATATFTAGVVGGTGHADAAVDGSTTTANFTITPAANLAVTKTAAATVVAGNTLTYTITVSNSGPSAAGNLVLSDTLPSGTSYVSQSQTGGSDIFSLSHIGNDISNTLASFPAGATATFQVVAKVSPSQPNASILSNTASAASSTHDTNPSNNFATANTTVSTSADLVLTKNSAATVIPGTNLTYTLALVNNGPSDAQNVSLADTLPAGLTFVSQEQTSGPAFTLSNPGNTIQNTLATLPAGASASFSVVAAASPLLTGGAALVNSAATGTDTSDPNTTNNSASTTVTVIIPLTITSANAATFTVGATGTFSVTTTGYPVPALTQAGALPAGVTFTDNGNGSATLMGTPAAGSGGSYPITFTASNGVLPNATQSFTLTVNQAPAVTSANATTFTVGAAGSFTVTATGYPIPALTQAGALPSGVTFTDIGNGSASLAGTPAAGSGGSYPITFTASNGVLPNATQSFTLTVNQALAITSVNNTTFNVGSTGAFTVTATGYPIPALSQTGALPSGVTFVDNGNGSATLMGTPAAGSGGSYPITFTASNGVLPNVQQPFTLTVNEAPVITSANTTSFTVGSANTFTVTSLGYPPAALSLTGVLPAGVTFTDNGGGSATLAGNPATGGDYPLQITAHSTSLPDAVQAFTLHVGLAPAFTSADNTTFTVGSAASFTITTNGIPAPSLTISGTLPGGVTFADNADGTASLAGTPALGTVNSYTLTFTAHNGFSTDVQQSFTLEIKKAVPVVTVVTTPNPSVFSQVVTLTANVTSSAGIPTGSVQFSVDGLDFGPMVSLVGGTATLTAATLSPATYVVSATYYGDANFTLSTPSTPVNHVVMPAATSTSLVAAFSPELFKRHLILTATVTTTQPTGTAVAGTVTFLDGVTPLATVALDASGTAELVLPNVTRGSTYNISATYNAAPGYLPSAETKGIFIPHILLLINIMK